MLHVKASSAFLLLACLLGSVTLSACDRYQDTPSLREAVGPPPPFEAKVPEQNIAKDLETLLKANESKTFKFCNADEDTRSCKRKRNQGLSGVGLGGVYVPLYLKVKGLKILDAKEEGDELEFKSRLKARVDGIPPLCVNTTATISVNKEGGTNIKFDPFYCNWMLIGNVVNQYKLSVDSVDLESGTFSGYYTVRFFGTGNAGGFGYFLAYPKKNKELGLPIEE